MHLIEILSKCAKQHPDKTAFIYLENGETEVNRLTYQALYTQTQAVSAQLKSCTTQGDRILLLFPSGLEFIVNFLGCLYAERVAVPAYPPRKNRTRDRLLAIAADAQPSLVLTTQERIDPIQTQFETTVLNRLSCQAINTSAISNLDLDTSTPELTANTLAFLQYTSGSTGTPKGVMVSHGNILYNQQMIQSAFHHDETTRFVGWLPLFHDMGLIGNILQPLYLGIPSILMSPTAFLQKPVRWLQAISKYRATTSGGPNFAYDLCVDRISPAQKQGLDLSSWTVAFNGAEPIRLETLSRFSDAFAEIGFQADAFYPCYGMAETTLLVSGGDPSQSPIVKQVQKEALQHHQIISSNSSDSIAIVGCGRTTLQQGIKVVDPNSHYPCPIGTVGEIWITGDHVAQGYWNRPTQTQDAFSATLATPSSTPYLRTGDLGFLTETGELFVTGRLKDVIILRGRNYYPQDIERVVEVCHPALRPNCGAAFAVDSCGQERLIVIHEVNRSDLRRLNANEVMRTMRGAIASKFDLQTHHILLLRTNSIFKTSSGKIQRQQCRTAFLNGELNIIAESHLTLPTEFVPWVEQQVDVPWTQDTIQTWLKQQVSKGIGISASQVATDENLDHYGLDSVLSIELVNTIHDTFAVEMTPLTLVTHSTLEHLSQYIFHHLGESDIESLNDDDSPHTIMGLQSSRDLILHSPSQQHRKLSPLTIGQLMSGLEQSRHQAFKSPTVDPLLMAKQLRVTFRALPTQYKNQQIIQFREQLRLKLQVLGVQIIPWEEATRPSTHQLSMPLGWKKSVTVNAVKANINAVIDIEYKPSIRDNLKSLVADTLYQLHTRTAHKNRKLSASKIVQCVSWANKNIRNLENPTHTQEIVLTDFNLTFANQDVPYAQKIPTGINTLLSTFSEIVVGVSDRQLSILNLNLSDTLCSREDLDQFILKSLIPKIYVPILPLPMSRFQIGDFDPNMSTTAKKLVDLGDRLNNTDLLPAGFKINNVVKYQFQKDILNWMVKGRTGVSYGFVAYLEPPIYIGAPSISVEEWERLSPIQPLNAQVIRQNSAGRRYIKLWRHGQVCYQQIPDIWVCSSRSGANKTQLNRAQDVVRIGLTQALEFQLPIGIDPMMIDVKPSYDLHVMLALGLASNLYLPDLVDQGAAMVHFHGYPAANWFQCHEYVAGVEHPSVPCGTYESGIFNFLGIQTIAERCTEDVNLAALVEPDHGVNMIASDLDYLVERLMTGVHQGQIELGGKHLPSLKALC